MGRCEICRRSRSDRNRFAGAFHDLAWAALDDFAAFHHEVGIAIAFQNGRARNQRVSGLRLVRSPESGKRSFSWWVSEGELVPVRTAKKAIPEIVDHGRVRHAYYVRPFDDPVCMKWISTGYEVMSAGDFLHHFGVKVGTLSNRDCDDVGGRGQDRPDRPVCRTTRRSARHGGCPPGSAARTTRPAGSCGPTVDRPPRPTRMRTRPVHLGMRPCVPTCSGSKVAFKLQFPSDRTSSVSA